MKSYAQTMEDQERAHVARIAELESALAAAVAALDHAQSVTERNDHLTILGAMRAAQAALTKGQA